MLFEGGPDFVAPVVGLDPGGSDLLDLAKGQAPVLDQQLRHLSLLAQDGNVWKYLIPAFKRLKTATVAGLKNIKTHV